jgi:hypothetical protein
MANVIEEAKTGRAACRTCKKPIAKGELRLGVEVQTQFSDTPSLQWHHLPCGAGKLPAELKEALASFDGEVPDRAALDKAMDDAIKSGKAKPGGFPHVDLAPTGRAKCLQCEAAIEKGAFRVVVEREVDAGGFARRSAGYLHPKCVAENLENTGGEVDEFVENLRTNSRIPEAGVEGVIAEIQGGGGE